MIKELGKDEKMKNIFLVFSDFRILHIYKPNNINQLLILEALIIKLQA